MQIDDFILHCEDDLRILTFVFTEQSRDIDLWHLCLGEQIILGANEYHWLLVILLASLHCFCFRDPSSVSLVAVQLCVVLDLWLSEGGVERGKIWKTVVLPIRVRGCSLFYLLDCFGKTLDFMPCGKAEVRQAVFLLFILILGEELPNLGFLAVNDFLRVLFLIEMHQTCGRRILRIH